MPRWANRTAKVLKFSGKIDGTADVDRIGLPLTERLAAGGGLPMAIPECKACHKCGETKPRSDFSRNRSRSDGLQQYCRICLNAYKRRSEKSYPWSCHALNPKYRARRKLRDAIRAGIIVRPSMCPACSAEGMVEAHHENYDEPYNVTWLCKSCHVAHHRKQRGSVSRIAKPRPTIDSIQGDGPALTPADLAHVLGISREYVADMCRRGEVEAFQIGRECKRRHWKIGRAAARACYAKMAKRHAA